jgi:hypothetical protein
VAADARTTVWGADAQEPKLFRNDTSYLILQAEFLRQQLDAAGWDSTNAAYTTHRINSNGGYAYADYNFKIRYNMGGGYEHYQRPVDGNPSDSAFKLWAGLSLMEETTAFRIDWDHYMRRPRRKTHTRRHQYSFTTCNFSMGPHKAHQF